MAGTKIIYISGLKPRVGAAITADSTPLLDGWGWADYWGCAEWMQWHQANVSKYGKAVANSKFITWWSKQDSFANPYNWCKYNSPFANYFKAQGIEVGWLLSNLVVGTNDVGTAVVNTAGNVSTGIQTASSGVQSLGSVLKYALPFAAIAGGAWAFNKYIKKIF